MIKGQTLDEASPVEVRFESLARSNAFIAQLHRAMYARPDQGFELLKLAVVEQASVIEQLQATLVEAIAKSPVRVKL